MVDFGRGKREKSKIGGLTNGKEEKGEKDKRANSRTMRLGKKGSGTPSSRRGCVTGVTSTDVVSMFATVVGAGVRTAVVSRVEDGSAYRCGGLSRRQLTACKAGVVVDIPDALSVAKSMEMVSLLVELCAALRRRGLLLCLFLPRSFA